MKLCKRSKRILEASALRGALEPFVTVRFRFDEFENRGFASREFAPIKRAELANVWATALTDRDLCINRGMAPMIRLLAMSNSPRSLTARAQPVADEMEAAILAWPRAATGCRLAGLLTDCRQLWFVIGNLLSSWMPTIKHAPEFCLNGHDIAIYC